MYSTPTCDSTSLAIDTIYGYTVAFQMHITESYLMSVRNSGGCISATKVRQMAIYMDHLITEYAKMNMPLKT